MKILVIRFSSIGDVILTTPLMRCVKQQLDGTEIHYLTKEAYQQILEHNPFIDRLFCYNKHNSKTVASLKNENYDYVIDLQKNLRSKKLCMALGRPSFSFPKLNIRKWLLVNFKINLLPQIHIVDRYFMALNKFGVKNDNAGLDFFFGPDDEKAINILPENFKAGYLTITCGSRHFTKQIPESLIKQLVDISPLPLVLLGGKDDEALAIKITDICGEKSFNACGKLNIRQSAYLVSQSQSLIAADTGLMHIAAALKKRVVSVWGNTVPTFGMYPYMPKGQEHLASIVEVGSLSCRPCSKLGFDKCPKKHFNCMNMQNPQKIIELAMQR
jgi:ADP-heptose:LPS heptosyltransferase